MAYEVPFEVPSITYEQSLEQLHQSLRFGICPLLETVEDMLEELDNPDLCYECVQIAGTNGKTSTSRYTAAILAGEGKLVALYTSPELVSYTERMEVGGVPVAEDEFAWGISAATEAGRRVNDRRMAQGERPYDVTEFDTLTVAALAIFARRGVDVAVLEVGMGGRWDATSAAKSIRAVAVTGIGLDHMRILGNTLEEIAGEKAAVIQAGRACVLGVGTATPCSVEDVFLEQAARAGVVPIMLRPQAPADAAEIIGASELRVHDSLPTVTFAVKKRPSHIGAPLELGVRTSRGDYGGLQALKPAYQAANIACAVALAEEYLGRALDHEALEAAVMACPTPGRFDVVRESPLALVDACHNPQSVEVFLSAIRAIEPCVERRPVLLCAVLADKDVQGIVHLLAQEFLRVVVTRTASARAMEPEALAACFRNEGVEPQAVCARVDEALDALANDPFVACGSITTAGEVAGMLRGRG